jgi:Tfp pilus assembly PilM family ATPase
MASGGPAVTSYGIDRLPEGALVPSLVSRNVSDRAALGAAISRVLARVGRPKRIGLVLPDLVAKVSLVRFDRAPERPEDLDRLVRWQVRRAAPFPADEAQISWVAGAEAPEGREFVVTIARRSVVEEYEEVCAAAGAHAGIVDLSTFNLVNAVLAGRAAPSGDWILVNTAAGYVSIALLRGPDLLFFRNRSADANETLADLVHQTAMYYEDRLQGNGFERAILSGSSAGGGAGTADRSELRHNLETRLGVPVEGIDARSAVVFPDRVGRTPGLVATLAPLVGLLSRDRVAA